MPVSKIFIIVTIRRHYIMSEKFTIFKQIKKEQNLIITILFLIVQY